MGIYTYIYYIIKKGCCLKVYLDLYPHRVTRKEVSSTTLQVSSLLYLYSCFTSSTSYHLYP